jgi:hypothetical protein
MLPARCQSPVLPLSIRFPPFASYPSVLLIPASGLPGGRHHPSLYERVPSFPILFPTSDLAPLSLPPRIALACVQNNSEQGGPFLILIR